jgi:hypothetical protein
MLFCVVATSNKWDTITSEPEHPAARHWWPNFNSVATNGQTHSERKDDGYESEFLQCNDPVHR